MAVVTDSTSPLSAGRTAADYLNRECFCVTLDRDALHEALRREAADPAFCDALVETRPHLFSSVPVFLPKADEAAMGAVVGAIEAAAQLEGYQQGVAAWAPEIARFDFGPRGVFMGYDFHLGADGPKLIEINTNAGGAFLNAFLARAQIACCDAVERGLAREALEGFERSVVAMFEAEWRAQGRAGRPNRIAIVDEAPEQQYLYPEFVLAQRLLERSGMATVIVDAAALRYEGGSLRAGAAEIDLVYNRLVDFAFDEPRHADLRRAYLDGAVVVTPNPRNHALFADKRNLTLLCDGAALRQSGLPETHVAALAGVPKAVRVSNENAAELWNERKRLFFKPASGHGGKAVYRGDKVTTGVWAQILRSDYIAQEFAPPGERMVRVDGERAARKVDVRLYTYEGEILLAAARLYQGQTTNFRTPGGGFAPVFFI